VFNITDTYDRTPVICALHIFSDSTVLAARIAVNINLGPFFVFFIVDGIYDRDNHMRKQRGGGPTETGSLTVDSMIDHEVFMSECQDDASIVRGCSVMPNTCALLSGRLEDGHMATAAFTCDDGACSLHALWGVVINSPAGGMYFCEDARQKLCDTMPDNVNTILNTRCGTAVAELLDSLWADVTDYVMRMTRGEPARAGFYLGNRKEQRLSFESG
jgi:hypothetical protein